MMICIQFCMIFILNSSPLGTYLPMVKYNNNAIVGFLALWRLTLILPRIIMPRRLILSQKIEQKTFNSQRLTHR